VIELESIRKSYGQHLVLNNLSLNVSKYETAVLLGPNGVGKTTVLNIIAGIVSPDYGRVVIDNRIVFEKMNSRIINVPPELRQIGYVPQDYALFPHLSVYENIAFGLSARKLSENDIRRRVKELIDFLSLNGIENKYPHQLSGSEKQKVALARALAPEPRVILLDEQLSSIDPGFREYIRWELREFLKKLKITTLIVTHNLDDAWALADRIMIMLKGTIVSYGTPHNILSRIKSREVAKFLGLNALEGRIVRRYGNNAIIRICDDIELIAKNTTNNVSEGDKVLVIFRPDDVIIHSRKESNMITNVIKAKILRTQISKCNMKLFLQLSQNNVITAEISRGYIFNLIKNQQLMNSMIYI